MLTQNFLATLGILALLFAIMAAGALLIRSIRADLHKPAKPGSVELLKDLEAAYRKGQMDTAEFERVRGALEEQKHGRAASPATGQSTLPRCDAEPPPSPVSAYHITEQTASGPPMGPLQATEGPHDSTPGTQDITDIASDQAAR